MPSTYPSTTPPSFELHGSFLTNAMKQALKSELEAMYIPNETDSCIYNCIEWIRSNAFDKCQLQVVEQELVQRKQQIQEEANKKKQQQEEAEEEESFDQLKVRYTEYSKIKITSGNSFTISKSKFVAHVATVRSEEDVREVLYELYKNKKIAEATHNMTAYRFETPSVSVPVLCFSV